MPQELFLSSSAHAVAHDIAKKVDLTKGNKLVFITTASESEEGDKSWLQNDRQALVNAGFDVSDYTLTEKTEQEVASHLQNFDYLHFEGGSTAYLLEKSQKANAIPIIKDLVQNQGKIYIGSSAGSIITGPRLPEYYSGEGLDLKNRNCYNFINTIIMPHWGSEDFKDLYLEKRIAMSYHENQFPIIALTDTQYIHVQGNSMKIIDTKD